MQNLSGSIRLKELVYKKNIYMIYFVLSLCFEIGESKQKHVFVWRDVPDIKNDTIYNVKALCICLCRDEILSLSVKNFVNKNSTR